MYTRLVRTCVLQPFQTCYTHRLRVLELEQPTTKKTTTLTQNKLSSNNNDTLAANYKLHATMGKQCTVNKSVGKMKDNISVVDEVDLLMSWGFGANQCQHCNTSNRELDGMLMQCAYCKMAYYCSQACYEAIHMEHQKYCIAPKW